MSTPDLIVMKFRMGCRQTDLAAPLELFGPVFKVGGVSEERAEVWGIPDRSWRRELQRGEELSG